MPGKKIASFLTCIATLRKTPAAGYDLRNRIIESYKHQVLNNLEKLLEIEDIAQQNFALREYLAANWDLTHNTLLSYTSLPQHDITLLLCDVALFAAEQAKTLVIDTSAIALLMPTVALESSSEAVAPDLDTLDLKTVLQTHILGEGGSYLVPVQRLLDAPDKQILDAQGKQSNRFYNFYFDVNNEKHKGKTFLSEQDIEQLKIHSAYSEAVVSTKSDYESSLKADQGLLFHLQTLLRQLSFYSTEGVGSEKKAGEGVYNAIITFNDYYLQLDAEIRNTIPSATKTQIELLRSYAFDSSKNPDAESTIDTCIATRRNKLDGAIKTEETALHKIGIKEQARQSLSTQRKTQCEEARKEFKHALESKSYQGSDKRGFTRCLLKSLYLTFAIEDSQDLNDLMACSPAEIKDLCNDKALQEQIVKQFENLEAWVMFIHETPVAKLEAILSNGAEHFFQKFAKTPYDIATLLISLDAERFQLLLKWIKIDTVQNLVTLLRRLPLEQRSLVFENLRDTITDLIKTTDDLVVILGNLSSEQYGILFEKLRDKILSLIQTTDNLGRVLNCLSPEQCTVLLKHLKDRLSQMIQSMADFELIINRLLPEKREAFFENMLGNIPDLIRTGRDFARIIALATPAQGNALLQNCESRIPTLIRTADDFGSVLNCLSPEQNKLLCENLKNKLPDLIRTGVDFGVVLKGLSPEKRKLVFEDLLGIISSLTWTIEALLAVLILLSEEQHRALLENLHDKIPNLIWKAQDFAKILELVSPEQGEILYDSLYDRIPHLIWAIEDFEKVLVRVSREQRETLCEHLTQTLPDIILTAENLGRVLHSLYPEQQALLCKNLKNRMPGLIKTVDDLVDILTWLSPKRQKVALDNLQDRVCALINTRYDFGFVLGKLATEQCPVLCQMLQNKIPDFIETAGNFVFLVAPLCEAKHDVLCENLQNRIPDLVRTTEDLALVLEFLSLEQCTALFENFRDRTPNFLQNMGQFGSDLLVKWLSLPIRNAVFENLLGWIVDLVKTSNYIPGENYILGKVLAKLSPEQCIKLFENLRPIELSMSKDTLCSMLNKISLEQGKVLCKHFYDRIQALIQTPRDLKYILNRIDVDKYSALLENLPNIHDIFKNIAQDFQGIDALFAGPYQNLFRKIYFESLLGDIKNQALRDSIADNILDDCYTHLENAISEYSQDLSPDALERFTRNCVSALEKIQSRASKNSPILPLIAKWLLTFATLGMTLLVSAIRNRQETGKFKNRFFKTELQEKADCLKELVDTKFYKTQDAP